MKRKRSLLLIGVLLVPLFTFSCTIGLGESVDTVAPSVKFTSPSPGAIIRDAFAIRGVWDDDGSISGVKIQLTALSTDSTTKNTTDLSYSGIVTGNNPTEPKEWSCIINPKDAANPIPDGTYEITVSILDNGDHTTTITRQIVIDNTPPVIVLQRPGTIASVNTIDKIDSADSYGQTFTLQGQAADDNNIDHINVKIYSDADCLNLLHTVTLNNVPLSIALDVAKWGESDYTKIYKPSLDSNGKPIIGGAKQFYCEIEAYDSAQRYPTDGKNQQASDTNGNCTTSYYLYEDLATSIFENYKITDVYHMMSGTYTSTSERSATDIISAVKKVLKRNEQEVGTFVLNPTNNPTFVVNGKSTLLVDKSCLVADSDYSIANGNDVTLEVSVGLDESPLVVDNTLATNVIDPNFRVYVQECDSKGNVKNGVQKIYPTQKSRSKSGSSYKFTINLNTADGLEIGKSYIFGVEGKDEAGNSIISSNNGYGFYFASAGSTPTLKDIVPDTSMVYVNASGKLTVSGKTTIDEGTPVVTISHTETVNDEEVETVWATTDSNASEPKITMSDPDTSTGKRVFTFTYEISNEMFRYYAKKTGGNAASTEFALAIKSKLGDREAVSYKTVMFDVDEPEWSFSAATPTLDSYVGAEGADSNGIYSKTTKAYDGTDKNYKYINGKVNVKGQFLDGFTTVKKYTWQLLQNNAPVQGIGGEINSSNVNFEFDTRNSKIADKKEINVNIKGYDTAGNETSIDIPFVIDQSTDKPLMEAQDGISWKTGILNPNYISAHADEKDALRTNILAGDLYSKLIDDDGIAAVRFEVKAIKPADAEAGDNETSKRYTDDAAKDALIDSSVKNKAYKKSGTEASVTHKMPSKAGFYEITEAVYDTNFVCGDLENPAILAAAEKVPANANYFHKETYVVKLQGKGPQVNTVQDSNYISTNDSTKQISIKLVIEDGEGPYTIVANRKGISTPVTVVDNAPDPADSSRPEFTDTFVISGIDFATSKEDIIYTITDQNGSTTKTVDFTVDNTAPDTLSIDNPSADDKAVGDLALNGEAATIRGTAKDVSGGSGMKYLWYAITGADATEPDWSDSTAYTKLAIGDGTWNLPIYFEDNGNTPYLPEGSYKLWVKGEDSAGNVSAVKARIFDVDQAAPEITEVELTYNNEAGVATPVTITNADTLFFKSLTGVFKIAGFVKESNGIKKENDISLIKINGEAPDSLDGPDSDGTYMWTKIIDYSANTKIPLKVIVSDKVNRTSTLEYSIYCDTTAPALEMTNPDYDIDITGKNALSKSKETFRANVNDGNGSGVTEYKYIFTQTEIKPTQNPTKAATETYAEYVQRAKAEIIASAESATSTWINNKDAGGKVITDIADTRNLVESGSGTDKLKEGSWYFYVYAKDSLGNKSVLGKPFWIDLKDPELTFEEINTPTNKNVVLKGTATDGNKITSIVVTVDDKVLASDGTLKTPASDVTPKNIYSDFITASGYELSVGTGGTGGLLSEGSHKITVTATDGAEKTTEISQTILVDTIKPAGGSIDTDYPAQTPTVLNTDENWYKNSTYTVKIKDSTITETGSKIDTVEAVIYADGTSNDTINAFGGSQTLKKSQPDSADKVNNEAVYKWTGKTEIPAQGLNKLYIKVTDKAGNVYISEPKAVIYLDTLPPNETTLNVYEAATDAEIAAATTDGNCSLLNVSSVADTPLYVKEVASNRVVNGKSEIVVYATASDDTSGGNGTYSGMKTIKYKYGSNYIDSTTTDLVAGYYKIKIPANTSQIKYQNGAAKFVAFDKVENASSAITAFNFELDEAAPEVTINPITDANSDDDTTSNIDVNGEFAISGTVHDDSAITKITVKYQMSASKTAPANTDSSWTSAKSKDVKSETTWATTINTKETGLEDKKYLHIMVEATDKATNLGKSAVSTVYINQDSDRPVITVTNLDLKNTADIWLTGSSTINGIITDDDGAISTGVVTSGVPTAGFCYKDLSAETPTWTPINVSSNGSWRISGLGDGSRRFIFYVKDSAVNATEFQTLETTVNATNNLTQPKLKSEETMNGETTYHWIGKDAEKAEISFKVDNQKPDVRNFKYSTDGGATYTSDSSELVFGGTSYNKFNIQFTAQDKNGVKQVKGTFNGTEYTAAITKLETDADETAAKKSGVTHTWTFSNVAIPSTMESGNVDFVIRVWDYSNADNDPGIIETKTFNIDNTAPTIDFTNYSNGDSVYATNSVTIRGRADENDISEWYYLVTDQDYTSTDAATLRTKIGTSKQLIRNQTFELTFNKHGEDLHSTPSVTYDKSLFSYICDLENKTETDLQNSDDERDLYLWVYGKDLAGNISNPVYLQLAVIPNGDKPSVRFTYPTKDGDKLGGTIRVTGSSEIQTTNVGGIYLQIDPNPDATNHTVTNDWETHLTNAVTAKSGTMAKLYPELKDVAVGPEGNKTTYRAIKASGSAASWNLTINQGEELNASQFVAVRVFAVNAAGTKMSDIRTLYFEIDINAPTIGSNHQLELVQFADGHIGATKTYGSGDSAYTYFDDTYITARQDYVSDKWIKGQWYLIGDASDGNGIKQITFKDNNSEAPKKYLVEVTDMQNNVGAKNTTVDSATASENAPYYLNGETKGWYVTEYGGANASSNYNYLLCIPVGNSTPNSYGNLSYTIEATEGTGQNLSATQTISLKYDNKAPEFAMTDSTVKGSSVTTKAAKFAKEYKNTETTPVEIVQNSGTYTMYGVFDEESEDEKSTQSGFSKVVFYFTRSKDGKTYLIDAMMPNDKNEAGTAVTDGRGNFVEINATNFDVTVSGTTITNNHNDGLYWYKFTNATITNNDTITLPTAPSKHIRQGGLAKINGVYYTIESVDKNAVNYNAKTVKINGSLQNATGVTVYFAAAQVVDHVTNEKQTTAAFNYATSGSDVFDYENNIDDGDQMNETITNSGTVYTWTAGIDSSLILDGNVDISFTAFDAAGNVTTKSYKGNVKNNAPRLYGVRYGTDASGNNQLEDSEWIDTYSQQYKVLIDDKDTDDTDDDEYEYGYERNLTNAKTEITIPSTERLTIKGLTKVKPQIVGGNVKLGYTYSYKENASGSTVKTTQYKDYAGTGHSNDGQPRTDDLTIDIPVLDFLKLPIGDGNQTLTFKVWDNTDGTTAGSDSYIAQVNLPVKVSIRDNERPVVYHKPFHWKNASDNSLYNNSAKYGHIELENDLPDTFTTGGSGVNDRDPKISGTVAFEGVATDNVVVKQLSVAIPDYDPDGNGAAAAGSEFVIATRAVDGTWNSAHKITSTKTAMTSDWGFQLVSDTYAADGKNTVKFILYFNTEKISTVAKTNANIVFGAQDRGQATLNAAKTDYTYSANTANAATVVEESKWSDVKADKTTTYYTVNTSGTLTVPATESTADDATVYTTRKKVYKVDVVPYVVKVETGLSKQKKSNWSVYNRSALGHYPVQSVIQKADDTKSGTSARIKTSEDVTLHGFNLNGATVVINNDIGTANNNVTVTAQTEDALSQIKFNVAKLASGELNATVNGIAILNNYNNNNAMGAATEAGNANVNKYNMQGNGDTNNILTDDLVFDVWEFNDRAAVPINGLATGVQMQVNQATKMLNFAFANGGLYYSMGGKVENVDYSSYYWAGDWDTFAGPCVGLGVDALGYTYSVDSGGDTNNSGHVDKYAFYTSRWGLGAHSTAGTYGDTNNLRLEEIAIKTGSGTYAYSLMKYRYLSSEFATSVGGAITETEGSLLDGIETLAGSITNTNRWRLASTTTTFAGKEVILLDSNKKKLGTATLSNSTTYNNGGGYNNKYYYYTLSNIDYSGTPAYVVDKDIAEFKTERTVTADGTNVYLVNYDALTDEIRFRAGAFSATTKQSVNGFVDTYTGNTPSWYATTNCQIIANSGNGRSFPASSGTTDVAAISGRGAGQYVDVAVATNGIGNKDAVCVVWFDAYDNCLKYSYSVDPIGNWDGTHKGNRTAAGWSTPTTIFEEGGEYCQIAVDANNHIHIAAYAGNGDVKYAYLDRYDSDSEYDESSNSCVVDASGAVGEHLTLDVALDDNGNSIPYIGYFTAAIKAPKYAYLVDTSHANKVPAGVDDDERFTGAWEVTVVPTPSRLTTNREDKVNIGVFKTTGGVLTWSTANGSAPTSNNIGTNEAASTTSGYDSTETSKAYGNGSKNAVFAYQISGGTGSCIETAQMR